VLSVLVTGASTGIGRATVAALAGRGVRVWATVRTDDDERALRAAHGDAVRVLRTELTDTGSIEAAGAAVRADGPLHGLVNNAGAALPAPLEYVPLDVFRRQLEINLVAQLAVTQQVLPALRASRDQGTRARIVMIGSIGGRIAGPMLGGYHASKFALVALTDTLRAELAPAGIPVVLVEPGAVATAIWERGRSAGDALLERLPAARERYAAQIDATRRSAEHNAAHGAAPERVADVVLTALAARRPQPRYLVGRDARIAALLGRVSLRAVRRVTAARA